MLALIAGQGALPSVLAQALDSNGRPFIVAALKDSLPDVLDRPVDVTIDMADLGGFFGALKSRGVSEVTMAGAVTRPDLAHSQDAASQTAGRAWRKGDDGLLKVIISLFEEHGVTVTAAHVIAPDLLPEPGMLAGPEPTPEHTADADHAEIVQRAIGQLDIGQACVVSAGQVLAIETDFGTASMLGALANQRDGATGGIFYKAPKPEQERRADLPIIGPDTILQAAEAGLDGLVIEAGGVMVLDRGAIEDALAKTGLFLWVRSAKAAV